MSFQIICGDKLKLYERWMEALHKATIKQKYNISGALQVVILHGFVFDLYEASVGIFRVTNFDGKVYYCCRYSSTATPWYLHVQKLKRAANYGEPIEATLVGNEFIVQVHLRCRKP